MPKKPRPAPQFRSAITGRYVTPKTASRHPKTTVAEKRK